jgi:DNA repair exonuclease SbcCD ATPase subunit
MITITAMTVSGFGPFKDMQEVSWDSPSTLVLGHSFDASASESNGTGKSSLFKALTWALYGETPDGSSGNDILNQRSKVASVTVSFKDGKRDGYVNRSRTQGNTKAKFCLMDSKQNVIEEVDGAKLVAQSVERLLGMDWPTFKNTIMYCQGDYKRFADPSTTDSERKSILRKILGLEVIADCAALSRKRISTLKQERTGLEGQHGELERSIGFAKSNLDDAKIDRDNWTKEQEQKKTDLEGDTRRLKKKLAGMTVAEGEMNRAQAGAEKAQKQVDDLDGEKDILVDKKAEWYDKFRAKEHNKTDHQRVESELLRKLKALDVDKCPVCDSKMSGKSPKAYKADLEKQLKDVRLTIEDVTGLIQQLEKEWRACDTAIDGVVDNQNELCAIRSKFDGIVDEKSKAIQLKSGVEAQIRLNEERLGEKGENPFLTIVRNGKKQIDTESGRLKEVAKQLSGIDGKIGQLEFWVKAYGTEGFINWCLALVLPQLEITANQYLSILTDGAISLSLDTQSTQKDKKVVDKLGINLDIENNGSVKPSGGQSKRISLALSLALMFLVRSRTGANISNLFLDEPDGGLDGGGKDRFYGPLLDELKQQHGNIAVITHDPNVRGLFDDVIMVKRQKGVSWLNQK